MYYDIDLVANPEILETMMELSQCTICTGLVIDPKQCDKCENAFCRICVESWLKKNPSCPFKCQSPIFKEAGRALKTMINKLILKCPRGCTKTFNYENLKSHICENSEKLLKECPSCGTKVNPLEIKPLNSGKLEELEKKIHFIETENKNLWQENVKLKFQLEELTKNKAAGKNSISNSNIIIDYSYLEKKNKNNQDEIQNNNVIDSFINENQINENRPYRHKKISKLKENEEENNKFRERKKRIPAELIDPKDLPCKHRNKRNLTKGMDYQFSCCGKQFKCKKCHNELSDHYAVKPTEVRCFTCNTMNYYKKNKCERCEIKIYLEYVKD